MGNCLTSKQKKYVESTATFDQMKKVYSFGSKKSLLGAGSYGKVFKAEYIKDPEMKVAIKMINKTEMDAADLENLHREVEVMAKVDHPNIVKYFETYNDKVNLYLVMELCTGGELLQKVTESGKPMGEAELAAQMSKLFKALVHCHQQNIVHRDIKPENIMFGADGEIKLIDFGFAV